MIHISGATTAREMWEQLSMVKESKGQLGVLATRRALFRATAEEGVEMVQHVSKLRQLQEEISTGILGQLYYVVLGIKRKQAERKIARTGRYSI